MSLHFRWHILAALPKQVSVEDFLLASHLGRAKGMTWHYITKRYPRSLTEMISDRGLLWRAKYLRWRKSVRAEPITLSLRSVILLGLLLGISLFFLLVMMPVLTMPTKMVDSIQHLWTRYP